MESKETINKVVKFLKKLKRDLIRFLIVAYGRVTAKKQVTYVFTNGNKHLSFNFVAHGLGAKQELEIEVIEVTRVSEASYFKSLKHNEFDMFFIKKFDMTCMEYINNMMNEEYNDFKPRKMALVQDLKGI